MSFKIASLFKFLIPLSLLTQSLIGLQACATKPVYSMDTGLIAKGSKLFHNPLPGQDEFTIYSWKDKPNTVTCSHCHATFNEADPTNAEATATYHPGSSMYNAIGRGSWKNGTASKIEDAYGSCVRVYHHAPPLEPESIKALNAYLNSLSPDKEVEPLHFQYVTVLPGDMAGGNKAHGRELVEKSCAICHNGGVIWKLDISARFGLEFQANKIRGIGRSEQVDIMQPYGSHRLTDNDLKDIMAYLYYEAPDYAQYANCGGKHVEKDDPCIIQPEPENETPIESSDDQPEGQ